MALTYSNPLNVKSGFIPTPQATAKLQSLNKPLLTNPKSQMIGTSVLPASNTPLFNSNAVNKLNSILTPGQTKAANNIPPTIKSPAVSAPVVQKQTTPTKSIYRIGGSIYDAQTNQKIPDVATLQKDYSGAREVSAPTKTSPSPIQTPTPSPVSPISQPPTAPVVSPQQTKLDTLYKTILGTLKPSEQETKTAEQLAQTNQAMREGLLNTENQVIPMEFITGQQASIEKRGTAKAQTLQEQLANLQTQRNANLAAATTGANILGTQQTTSTAQREFENTLATSGYKPYTSGIMLKPGESTITLQNPITGESKQYIAPAAAPKEITAGASLYDPTTGKIIAQAPSNTEMTEYQKAQLEQAGQITPYQQAQLEIEKAKAGLATGKADPIKLEQVTRQLDLLDEIESSPSLNAVTGLSSTYRGLIPGTPEYDLKSKIDSLKSNLTLGNMGIMKGVLSDSDMKVITQASSALKVGMSEEGFKNELTKIRNQFNQALERSMGTGATETKTDGWF